MLFQALILTTIAAVGSFHVTENGSGTVFELVDVVICLYNTIKEIFSVGVNMWSSGRRVLQDVLNQAAVSCRNLSLTPVQNTVVVERWWQVPLSKEGRPPKLHPRRHRIYKLVEDTKQTPIKKMELILTQTVPKLGGRGDTVSVKKSVGRYKLLPQGLAVYPSPENKQIFVEELRLLREGKPEDRIQTRTGQLTMEFLKRSTLNIHKMPSEEFQLTKEVVCRQFLKKLGVVVPLHALSFPFEPIKDLGDYWCDVTINGINTVRVPISLVPYEDPSASYQRTLKMQKKQQAATCISEAVDEDATLFEGVSNVAMEGEAGKDSLSQDEVSGAEVTTSATQTTQDTTAPPSDGPKKD